MILNKLKATIKHRDHLPGTWETPVNPDGPEAAVFIQNMIDHFGHVIKIALENIDNESVQKEIYEHARLAIYGNKSGLPKRA